MLDKAQEQLQQNGKIENIEANLPFCIKKPAMSTIVETQLLLQQTDSLDGLIERLDRLTKDIDRCMNSDTNTLIFHEKEEKEIANALEQHGLCVKDISFITDEGNCKRCNIRFDVTKDVLYEKIVKNTVFPYFPGGLQIKFETFNSDILANIKERTVYALECAALCKTKDGETICGDQAIGFTGSKNKYYLLLADGMGCGKDACIQSELIIKTLKKLIKGGLSVVAALNTYRSITRINEPFGFSTIDICAIDLNTGNTELYKAGAFDSFLLSNGRCFLFSGGGIPIGLTDTDRIKHETIKLHHGDYLILASDGLVAEGERIEQLLLEAKDDDVRSFAKKILYTHSEQNPDHGDDDITVMVCKIKKTEE